eukprot:879811_1
MPFVLDTLLLTGYVRNFSTVYIPEDVLMLVTDYTGHLLQHEFNALDSSYSSRTTVDPSDTTHPLHGIVLALFESRLHARNRIEQVLNNYPKHIQQLTLGDISINTGSIFLFYKTITGLDKSDEIVQFETAQKFNFEVNQPIHQDAISVVFGYMKHIMNVFNINVPQEITSIILTYYHYYYEASYAGESSPNALDRFVHGLEQQTFVDAMTPCKTPTSFEAICNKIQPTFDVNERIKVYVCHMIETKSYECKKKSTSVDIDSDIESLPEWGMGLMADEYDEAPWDLFAIEHPESTKPQMDDDLSMRVVIKSLWSTCHIECEFEMNHNYTQNVEILHQYIMMNQNEMDPILIIAYNPVQTLVAADTIIRDVTHPSHVYTVATDLRMYATDQLSLIYPQWMVDDPHNETIISTVRSLSKGTKQYNIIIVPASVCLDEQNCLIPLCEQVSPLHKAIEYGSDDTVMFVYRGLLYAIKKDQVNMIDVNIALQLLNNNILRDETMRLNDEVGDNICAWLSVGFYRCMCQWYGSEHVMDIEDSYDSIQRAMFDLYAGAIIPYNGDIVKWKDQCPVCCEFMINPSNTGNPNCEHLFCECCIKLWRSIRNSQSKTCPICKCKIIAICIEQSTTNRIKSSVPTTIYQQRWNENYSQYRRHLGEQITRIII